MTDVSLTIAKLVLVTLSLLLMASAVSAFVGGQVQVTAVLVVFAVLAVVLFSTLG